MAGVLTVVAKIYPKPGRETEIEALLVKMAAAVRQHEPDCLVYRPHRSTGEPIVFYFYEQYRTDAAFELHRTAPHLAGYRGEMRSSSPGRRRSSSTARSRPDAQAGAASVRGAGASEIAQDMKAAAPERAAPATKKAV